LQLVNSGFIVAAAPRLNRENQHGPEVLRSCWIWGVKPDGANGDRLDPFCLLGCNGPAEGKAIRLGAMAWRFMDSANITIDLCEMSRLCEMRRITREQLCGPDVCGL
jgi:hypothetical protein